MDTAEKLEVLSGDSRYDLACACGSTKDEHRKRGPEGRWLYPVALGNGQYTVLFKTLLSNACANDCKYCPLRAERDARRCALEPAEAAETFLDYLRRGKVSGLFLSSGVTGSPDIPGEITRPATEHFKAGTGTLFETPDQVFMREHRLYQADFLLRKYGFTGKDILFRADGNLDLARDPKQAWADAHPEFYPVNVNRAEREALFRVPGLGPAAVSLILKLRREGRLCRPEAIGVKGVRAEKIKRYAVFE